MAKTAIELAVEAAQRRRAEKLADNLPAPESVAGGIAAGVVAPVKAWAAPVLAPAHDGDSAHGLLHALYSAFVANLPLLHPSGDVRRLPALSRHYVGAVAKYIDDYPAAGDVDAGPRGVATRLVLLLIGKAAIRVNSKSRVSLPSGWVSTVSLANSCVAAVEAGACGADVLPEVGAALASAVRLGLIDSEAGADGTPRYRVAGLSPVQRVATVAALGVRL